MTRQQLIENIRRKRSFLCVGLDSDPLKLPDHMRGKPDAVISFNKAIIDATALYCVAYKPNLAFYEAAGADGWQIMEQTVKYIRRHHPDQLIIADAKRGDIGNTSKLYARSFFDHMDVDAITVAPYMGEDSVTPFLGHEGKWVILLALTSNPGSQDFQMLPLANGKRLFEQVIETARTWATPDELMMVVGATRGPLFEDVRRAAPDNFLLVPGVGAQGGSLEEVCRYGMTADCGLLVNSSRGIIFASHAEDFALRAAEEAARLAREMDVMLSRYSTL